MENGQEPRPRSREDLLLYAIKSSLAATLAAAEATRAMVAVLEYERSGAEPTQPVGRRPPRSEREAKFFGKIEAGQQANRQET